MSKFLYKIWRLFYVFFNGRTPETTKELKRVHQAIDKVNRRSNYLQKNFFENRDELFKLLSIKEMLVNYECDLYGYSDSIELLPSLGLNGSADSQLVDEILDCKW